ncbi:MAG: DEAD/DEAH box helicase family protein [Deltaproteobacteria bacterium]|nr:DEAD/DEAH box helicase family protein [Deltaproteobacteria bacterium]
MLDLNAQIVKKHFADSPLIYERGVSIYENGAFFLKQSVPERGIFDYQVDGSYGEYAIRLRINDDAVDIACDCPYPGKGCKHAVAALLDARDILRNWKRAASRPQLSEPDEEDFLTAEEIRLQALEDRKVRARSEVFTVIEGEMFKGEHLLMTADGKQYTVILHDPVQGTGHCSCPDYQVNRLGTCKHLIYFQTYFHKKKNFKEKVTLETFPFYDLFWDSTANRPRIFYERPVSEIRGLGKVLKEYFDSKGFFNKENLTQLYTLLDRLEGIKSFRIDPALLDRLDRYLQKEQLAELAKTIDPPPIKLNTRLYPYQQQGVAFGLFKDAVLIGDEMGLGKTLQAIALAISKKDVFGFEKVLVVTPASLKEQWKREIERFSDETAAIIEGPPARRQEIYEKVDAYFKITNYEAVLRDVTPLARFKPDLVILDEAQRIKNFSTKTAEAVKSIPRKHSIVLTGTPLENRLEDVYSIVQFLNPLMLAPLWQFAADHYMLSRKKKGKIIGYRNLESLHERLKQVVIRRRKEEVLKDLPRELVNNYYLDLHHRQQKIHAGYAQALMPLLNKKYLTPMDLRRIQELLLRMRMVCNSTYLIDRKTHISPKLKELEGILEDFVIQNGRKMVIFSEWTTMTYLIGRHLSDAKIPFVELSGKIPVKKRQALIDEFTNNPQCRVFLSTDAGGTGLNLQAADCVLNFELPWNPSRMRQRIGRVNRIGQKSRSVNVVNLITKNSIEEKILAGLQLKEDLFRGVFDGGIDVVKFSREKRTELINKLREMLSETTLPPPASETVSDEIPEDTPHYLNPEVLNRTEVSAVDVTAEETDGGSQLETSVSEQAAASTAAPEQSPEKLEEVLNTGLAFIGGLLEMATGRKLKPTAGEDKLLHIDKTTGEVTMKFRLPGFSI